MMDKIQFENEEVKALVKYLENKYDLPKLKRFEFIKRNEDGN